MTDEGRNDGNQQERRAFTVVILANAGIHVPFWTRVGAIPIPVILENAGIHVPFWTRVGAIPIPVILANAGIHNPFGTLL